jgi:hypothetical protein
MNHILRYQIQSNEIPRSSEFIPEKAPGSTVVGPPGERKSKTLDFTGTLAAAPVASTLVGSRLSFRLLNRFAREVGYTLI